MGAWLSCDRLALHVALPHEGGRATALFACDCGTAKDCNAEASIARAWRNAHAHARYAMKIDRTRGFEMAVG